MANPFDLKKLRELLLKEWDPLEVGANPNLSDEYDRYLPGVARLVESSCQAGVIDNHLAEIEKQLGAPLPAKKRATAVEALLRLR